MKSRSRVIRLSHHAGGLVLLVFLVGLTVVRAQTAKPATTGHPKPKVASKPAEHAAKPAQVAKPAPPAAPPDPGLIGAPAAETTAAAPTAAGATPINQATDPGSSGPPSVGAPEAAPAANQPAAATAPKPPERGFVWLDKDNFMVGNASGIGSQAVLQVFGFDDKKKTAGDLGGIAMTLKDTPVPLVIYGFGSNFTANMSGQYSNLILDFSAAKEKIPKFKLGAVEATDGGMKLADIDLNVGDLAALFISPDYVVFPEQARALERDGPFALLDFSNEKAGDAGAAPAGSTLILTRNGAEVIRMNLADGPDASIELKRVNTTNDVLSWRVEDTGGSVTHQEVLGFPVRGASPGVVKYEINIGDHPSTAAK
jgi:hypothetical protein